MAVNYESFRTWAERVTLFDAISAEEKAELVRTHIRRWLEANRERLNPAQIEMMEENIAYVKAELYVVPKSDESRNELKALEARTAALFSGDQIRDALTMHWDLSCRIEPPLSDS